MLSENELEVWLFDLFTEKEALERYETPIRHLFRMCLDQQQVDIIKHTVKNLHVLPYAELPGRVTAMAERLVERFSDDRPLGIVAMAYDYSADSSQTIVHMLKSRIPRAAHWKIFNSVPNYMRKPNLEEYPRYVLIDDFTGSGQTVDNRIREIGRTAAARQIEVEAHACLLFGMQRARQALTAAGHDIIILQEFQAGLSGYFVDPDLSAKKEAMLALEAHLAPEVEGIPLPSMGFGGAEALHCIDELNAPNSNFPIFWWPVDVNQKERPTVMTRAFR